RGCCRPARTKALEHFPEQRKFSVPHKPAEPKAKTNNKVNRRLTGGELNSSAAAGVNETGRKHGRHSKHRGRIEQADGPRDRRVGQTTGNQMGSDGGCSGGGGGCGSSRGRRSSSPGGGSQDGVRRHTGLGSGRQEDPRDQSGPRGQGGPGPGGGQGACGRRAKAGIGRGQQGRRRRRQEKARRSGSKSRSQIIYYSGAADCTAERFTRPARRRNPRGERRTAGKNGCQQSFFAGSS